MSIQAVSWVLEHSKATLGARLALISIANNADKRGENSCPGFSTIAEEACFSRRAAVTAVAKLLEEKHVEVMGVDPKYKTNIYRVLGMLPGEATSPSTPEMASEETSPRSEESSPAPSEETSRGGEAASEVDDNLLPITRLPIKTKELERATKKRCRLPTNLIPDQTTAAVAADLGLNLTAELAHFRDHHTAKGTMMADWQAGMRTWLHRAQQFRPKGVSTGTASVHKIRPGTHIPSTDPEYRALIEALAEPPNWEVGQ